MVKAYWIWLSDGKAKMVSVLYVLEAHLGVMKGEERLVGVAVKLSLLGSARMCSVLLLVLR